MKNEIKEINLRIPKAIYKEVLSIKKHKPHMSINSILVDRIQTGLDAETYSETPKTENSLQDINRQA